MIMGIVEKQQAKYRNGYKQGKELRDPRTNMAVTNYAWERHKKLVKEAVKRRVFLTCEREDSFVGKISCGNPNSAFPCFVEVAVWPEEAHHNCPCKLYDEEGITCEHVIALMRANNMYVRDKWWFHRRYHSYTYFSSYSAEVPALAINHVEADPFFAPPDYRKPAGRPTKARKDRSSMNKTDRLNTCGACGGPGHSYRTCSSPSTQYRYDNNFDRALERASRFNSGELE